MGWGRIFPRAAYSVGQMYVCNCNGLTQKQVREAIDRKPPRDEMCVYRYYQCEPQCGRCVPEIREMLIEARETEAA
jgi:bacterioferritin-associated ferredoxin